MKVAVATENGYVAPHFGHCPEFTLAEIVDGQVKQKVVIPNPGHRPGFLPGYLADLGVTHVITGGIGPRAQELFLARGIIPLVGVRGTVDEALTAFLTGTLATGPSLCNQDSGGHGRCGGGCGGHEQ